MGQAIGCRMCVGAVDLIYDHYGHFNVFGVW